MWFRKNAPAPAPASSLLTLNEQFDRAKLRKEIVDKKIKESALTDLDKQDAFTLNEIEYRKVLERLICT